MGKSNNFNLGVELGLWDRIDVNADFFIKETKDMLYASPLATSEGSPTFIYRNEMDMKILVLNSISMLILSTIRILNGMCL